MKKKHLLLVNTVVLVALLIVQTIAHILPLLSGETTAPDETTAMLTEIASTGHSVELAFLPEDCDLPDNKDVDHVVFVVCTSDDQARFAWGDLFGWAKYSSAQWRVYLPENYYTE